MHGLYRGGGEREARLLNRKGRKPTYRFAGESAVSVLLHSRDNHGGGRAIIGYTYIGWYRGERNPSSEFHGD